MLLPLPLLLPQVVIDAAVYFAAYCRLLKQSTCNVQTHARDRMADVVGGVAWTCCDLQIVSSFDEFCVGVCIIDTTGLRLGFVFHRVRC